LFLTDRTKPLGFGIQGNLFAVSTAGSDPSTGAPFFLFGYRNVLFPAFGTFTDAILDDVGSADSSSGLPFYFLFWSITLLERLLPN